MASLPQVTRGQTMAESPSWHALQETFATTPHEVQEKYNSLVSSDPQAYQGLDHKIHSAVQLQEDATDLGSEMREGFVLTELHWNGIVQGNAKQS